MARISISPETIKRGDLWAIDFRPGRGREVAKRRPGLVISNDTVNSLSPTIIVIPISSQGYKMLGPERIFIPQKDTNLVKDSVILVTQIRAIDKTRLIKKIDTLSKTKLREVEEAVQIVLGLEEALS